MNPRVSIPVVALFAILAACGDDGETGDNTTDRPEANGAALQAYLEARRAEFGEIPAERAEQLGALADLVVAKAAGEGPVQMMFICTHNSRRSHLAAVWAQIAADRNGLAGTVETFSGGTEATAFNPRAVAALQRAGLDIKTTKRGENPVYAIRTDPQAEPIQAWSKTFDDPLNPQQGFLAVMVCSDADEKCPVVPGAVERVAVPYVDPKVSDGTDQEAATYDERCAQIAREMLYVFSQAAAKRG